MTKRIEKLDKKNYESYSNLSLEKLMLYAIYTLEQKHEPTALDDIAVRAFNLFPEKFSMKNYNEYPDSMRVGREIWRLNSKNKIKGSESEKQFLLTEEGRDMVDDIKEDMKNKSKKTLRNSRRSDERDYQGKLVNYILANDLYKDYKNGNLGKKIPTHRFKNLLLLPMSASNYKVEKQYNKYLEACELEDRQELIDFLKYCKDNVSLDF